MFCPKCGTQALDGAGFCQKCGAKLIADASPENPVQPEGKTPETVPKKKNPKKLPIILGVVFVLIVILIAANADNLAKRGEQAAKDEEYISSHQQSSVNTADYLTYTDETEGFSFKYPSGWTLNEMVDYGVEDESGISMVCLMYDTFSSAQVAIQKITNPLFIDCVFSDDSEFLNTFGYNFEAADKVNTSIEDLHGIPIRKMSYTVTMADYEIIHQAYIYTTKDALYKVEFTCKNNEYESQKGTFDTIIDSYTILAADSSAVPTVSSVTFPLTVSTDAAKLFDEWVVSHPLDFDYHMSLNSDDWRNDDGSSTFLFDIESGNTIVFMVSIRKSDGYMQYIYNRGGAESLDDWYAEQYSEGTAAINPSYQGVPLASLLGCAPVQLYEYFGVPSSGTPVNGEMYLGGEYYGYDGIMFLIDYATSTVGGITGAAGTVEVDGSTLEKSRAEIVELLGKPSHEENFHDEMGELEDCYYMEYVDESNGTVLRINLPDSNSVAESFEFYPYVVGM